LEIYGATGGLKNLPRQIRKGRSLLGHREAAGSPAQRVCCCCLNEGKEKAKQTGQEVGKALQWRSQDTTFLLGSSKMRVISPGKLGYVN
jgi:hypothetical protein